MMPGPGASVDARAAMICTSAQGVCGAAVGTAPAGRSAAARVTKDSKVENIV